MVGCAKFGWTTCKWESHGDLICLLCFFVPYLKGHDLVDLDLLPERVHHNPHVGVEDWANDYPEYDQDQDSSAFLYLNMFCQWHYLIRIFQLILTSSQSSTWVKPSPSMPSWHASLTAPKKAAPRTWNIVDNELIIPGLRTSIMYQKRQGNPQDEVDDDVDHSPD